MSLNDPNWGRGNRGPDGSRGGPGGGNQGPPDLDELWRNFNRRLGELFRRRPRGAGDEPPRPPSARGIGGGASALIGLVLAVWLASGFYIVVEGQRGVVLTFGRFAKETTAGLNWRMPWPIQSHEIVNLSQVRTLEVGYRNNVRTKVLKESLMLTDDENIVDLQFAVQYVVKDAQAFIFNVRRPDESAMQIAETAMREVIGKNRMDAILYETQVDIANKSRDLMQAIHDRYNTGIQISTVTIQNAQPPEQVQAAFDDAVKAGQDRERQKNEGQAYANDVIPRARGAASRLQQESEGYKQRVIANAEGEASRFRQVLSEYSKAPQVTRERMYIDTMRDILSANNKIMMDYRGSGNLLMLPLEKLMQQSGAATPSGPQTAPAPNDTSQAQDASPRSRESLRNRDRTDR
ncbi:MAG TPA: FtsH protease activity modulator HflK [Burkholderiales bacterium]|jgi:membrane protease subunit HflK|nr:FtsH protease activity modulator HflK [Burkholderiales bacterium]